MTSAAPSTTSSAPERTPAKAGFELARALIILGAIALITLVYRSVPDDYVLLNKIAQYLYFLPIVIAGLWFGWIGGILAALATSVLYLPVIPLLTAGPFTMDEYGEALDLFITGSVVGVLANSERRKRMELQKANEELQETYRRLEQSIDKLRQSERFSAVGQLAANLAHEIRNPLASIEGAADLLQPGNLAPNTQTEFLQIIKKESRRLSRLLSDLLDFARPRSPEYVMVPLSEVANSVLALVLPTAQRSNVSIEPDFSSQLPQVQCDPAQIKQVILNLVINAIQAMPQGGTLQVRLFREKDRAVLEVRDHGPGVAAEALDQLFIPFYTTKKDGTGLGLPIAQQIMLAHGGTIRVESNQPKGSVFAMVLPLQAGQGTS